MMICCIAFLTLLLLQLFFVAAYARVMSKLQFYISFEADSELPGLFCELQPNCSRKTTQNCNNLGTRELVGTYSLGLPKGTSVIFVLLWNWMGSVLCSEIASGHWGEGGDHKLQPFIFDNIANAAAFVATYLLFRIWVCRVVF